MATKRAKLCLQRREDSTSGHHCCVPQCKASARFNCVVSFHTFPKDQELQKRWVAKIRRENLHITSHTRVCSRHFLSTDLIEPTNPDGRRRLKNGTVPLLFHWNNFTFPSPEPDDSQGTQQPDADTTQKEDPLNDVHYPDHDYCPTTEPKSSSSVSVTMDIDQPVNCNLIIDMYWKLVKTLVLYLWILKFKQMRLIITRKSVFRHENIVPGSKWLQLNWIFFFFFFSNCV